MVFGDSHAFGGVPDINLVESAHCAYRRPVWHHCGAIHDRVTASDQNCWTDRIITITVAFPGGNPDRAGGNSYSAGSVGTGVVLDMLNMEFGLAMLLTILIAKAVMTAFCLCMGFYGGIFSPALFVGGGRCRIQKLLASIGIMVSGPVMVVCGMAAVASAVIGAPVSGVLIMLEMTMSYDYALAAMLSVVTAALVSHHIYGHSFFDRQLLDRGIDISQGRGHLEMMEIPVRDLVSDDYVTAHQSDSKSDVVNRMITHGVSESYLLDGRRFWGKLTLHELLQQPDDIALTEASDDNAKSIKHDASLMQP